jgi:molybdopterin molybdotransferase
VTFELLVRPAVNALHGLSEPLPRFGHGTLVAPIARNAHRLEFVRARLERGEDGGALLAPLSGQESHMIARAAPADALVEVEPGEGALDAGARVRFLPLA